MGASPEVGQGYNGEVTHVGLSSQSTRGKGKGDGDDVIDVWNELGKSGHLIRWLSVFPSEPFIQASAVLLQFNRLHSLGFTSPSVGGRRQIFHVARQESLKINTIRIIPDTTIVISFRHVRALLSHRGSNGVFHLTPDAFLVNGQRHKWDTDSHRRSKKRFHLSVVYRHREEVASYLLDIRTTKAARNAGYLSSPDLIQLPQELERRGEDT
ncbi:hypothetical protein DFH09DRAFT_1075484 [Mycena vulgaris]|nr:hypothetical protein DFH09DRAFT_1075484 [Mycena vulgaris]